MRFIYFGGGTPSYISADQLRELVSNLKSSFPWDSAEEVAFECEPGTLTRTKLEALKEIGVTRLSLGIESFDDEILRENGRAHVSNEIYRVRPWIEELGFDQLNIDLIAGMVGESERSWRDSVRKAIDYDPETVEALRLIVAPPDRLRTVNGSHIRYTNVGNGIPYPPRLYSAHPKRDGA